MIVLGMALAGAVSASTVAVGFSGVQGSQTLAGTFGDGDGILIDGLIPNGTGMSYSNTVEFSLGGAAPAYTVEVAAAWFSLAPFGNTLSFELTGPGGVVGGSGTPNFNFPNISSDATFQGLASGDYALTISGNILDEFAKYSAVVGITAVPVPAALVLFGSALGLLGMARRAQRSRA